MDLYILRHGQALEHGAPGYDDSERPLTIEGRNKLKKAVRGLLTLEVKPDLVVTSPYPRARQTAEIVHEGLGLKRALVFSDLLTPESGYEIVDWLASEHQGVENVMLVGHDPQLSGLISYLLTGDGRARIDLKKGGLCRLSVSGLGTHGQQASLRWLLTARQLSQLDT